MQYYWSVQLLCCISLYHVLPIVCQFGGSDQPKLTISDEPGSSGSFSSTSTVVPIHEFVWYAGQTTGKVYCMTDKSVLSMRFTCPDCLESSSIGETLSKHTWHKSSTFGGSTLQLIDMPVTRELNGKTLVCQARYNAGTSVIDPSPATNDVSVIVSAEAVMTVKYLDTPRIINEDGQANVFLENGRGVINVTDLGTTLICVADGNPKPISYSWILDGIVLVNKTTQVLPVSITDIGKSVQCALLNDPTAKPLFSPVVIVSDAKIDGSSPSLLSLLTSFASSKSVKWPKPTLSPLGRYAKAAVAAHNGLCSEIARDLLAQGGSVVDAAIGAAICIGGIEPQASGLGGGTFINIYNATEGKCHLIDAREVAPKAATQDMFVEHGEDSTVGYKAIGVPGELNGLWKAYGIGGVLPWRDLLMPTVKLLTHGFYVSEALADEIVEYKSQLVKEGTNMEIFFNENGEPYKRGELMKRPVLAKFLEQLAETEDPIQLFYQSEITKTMVEEIQNGGGIITEEDMSTYEAVNRDDKQILSTLPNGYKICGHPPPSSSAVTQSIIATMAGFKILNPKQNLSSLPNTVDLLHKYIEVMKFAYADRSLLGDISFVDAAYDLAKNITKSARFEEVRKLINERAHSEQYYGGEFVARKDNGTTHISVMDHQGNAVSITTTVNTHFGCMRRSPSTGILYNNQMDDFSTPGLVNSFGFEPSPSNFIVPGKRPMSSMSPSVVYDPKTKKAIMAIGCSGGSRIISSTAATAYRTMFLGQTLKEANDAPRFHNQRLPFYTEFEPNMPKVLVDELEKLGHQFKELKPQGRSFVQAVYRGKDGLLYANSDYRKGDNAYPAGY